MSNHPHPSLDQALTEVAVAQRTAMPTWRRGLRALFITDRSSHSTELRHHALALPDRRGFFRIGGISIAGAALLVACGDDDDDGATADPTAGPTDQPADPTDPPDPTDSPDPTTEPDTQPTEAGGNEMDLVLLRTATSLELAAVEAYQAAIDNADALGITAPVAEAAMLFQSHHAEHAAALQGATEEAGGMAYEEANPYFMDNVVNPTVAELSDEMGTVEFALDLENAASQTYTFAGGTLSTPTLRQTIMSIGGVEARHAAVLRGVLGQLQTPNVFNPTTEAAPEEAFISAT